MIEVKNIETKRIWDTYLEKFPKRTFLQTWEWGEFQFRSLKKPTHRIGIFRDNVLIGIALAIEEKNRFGKFLYLPRGPVCGKNDLEECLSHLIDHSKDNGFAFLRCDPEISFDDDSSLKIFNKLGARSSANFVQVQRCWIMDLKGIEDEEQMFNYAKENGMSKSIPRHIRKSAKEGVTTRISKDPGDIQILLDMLHGLAERKGIPQRPDPYYMDLFKYLAPEGIMQLIIAEYNGEPVSAILLSTYNKEIATLHGATKEDISPNLYVAKKIYWDAIMYGVNNGFERFNYWGVLSEGQMEKEPDHPSYGYSLFKRRMGGKEMLLIDTQDIPIKFIPWGITFLIEKYRKIKYKVD